MRTINKSPLDSFKVSGFGFTINTPSTGNLRIAAGVAIVNGYFVETVQEDITSGFSEGLNYIYLTLALSGGYITATIYTVAASASATVPSNSLELGIVTSTSGTLSAPFTAIIEPRIYQSTYVGDSDTSDRLIYLGAQPKLVIVSSRASEHANDFFAFSNLTGSTGDSNYGWWLDDNPLLQMSLAENVRPRLNAKGFIITHVSGADLNLTAKNYDYTAFF